MWITLGILVTTEPASSRSGECEETGAMGRKGDCRNWEDNMGRHYKYYFDEDANTKGSRV